MSQKTLKKRSNLRDVARCAGVSVATVSRVLNAPERVSPATRDRVQAAIAQMRFVPSAAARSINSGRTHMVAALLPTLDNSTYTRVVDGLEHSLADYGLSLIVAQTGDDQAVHLARAKQLIDAGAEGFVTAGGAHCDGFLHLVDHLSIPTVTVSHFNSQYALPTIGYDNAEAALKAAEHLIDLGHANIAVIHGPLAYNDRTRRRRAALEGANASARYAFFEVPLKFEGGCRGLLAVREAWAEATGIICYSDVLAAGVLSEAARQGIRVPRDVSVIGIENLPSSKFTHPPLTSVRLQVEQMGVLAAKALAGWVEHQIIPDPQKLDISLVQRASTAPPRTAA